MKIFLLKIASRLFMFSSFLSNFKICSIKKNEKSFSLQMFIFFVVDERLSAEHAGMKKWGRRAQPYSHMVCHIHFVWEFIGFFVRIQMESSDFDQTCDMIYLSRFIKILFYFSHLHELLQSSIFFLLVFFKVFFLLFFTFFKVFFAFIFLYFLVFLLKFFHYFSKRSDVIVQVNLKFKYKVLSFDTFS